MADTLIYTISTGRSGTTFLADLMRANLTGAQVHHERVGWLDLGVNCPDTSHCTRFNTLGNVEHVRAFWRRKLRADAATPCETYVETSHINAKAGLIENLDLVPEGVRIVIVALTRNPFEIAWSFYNRFDFANYAFTWLAALDPRYKNVIVSSVPFRKHGMVGSCFWYVIEMFTRAAYYRRLLADASGVAFFPATLEEIATEDGARDLMSRLHQREVDYVRLPPQANARKQTFFDDTERKRVLRLYKGFKWDAEALASDYFDAGRRLGEAGRVVRPRMVT